MVGHPTELGDRSARTKQPPHRDTREVPRSDDGTDSTAGRVR
ncbi:hypothetical protein [Haladaptatus sp. R4]|nr:hypothetical protein [Haladaptatus sp. R4]